MEATKWKFSTELADYNNAVRLCIGKYDNANNPLWRNMAQINGEDSIKAVARKLINLGISILENCE